MRHPNHVLSPSSLHNPGPNSSGSAATGIPPEVTIAGMKAIGAGHPMKVLAGSGLVTMASASITAIGKAHTAASSTTINGITITNAITAAITSTTIMATITAMITTTMTITENRVCLA